MDVGERRELDEAAAAATVSPIEADLDGWWCKAAPDLPFRRCNAVLPPLGAADDRARFDAGLDRVAAWYRALGLRLIVQVSTAAPGHERLDAWLAERGLATEAPVDLLVGPAPLPAGPPSGPAAVAVDVEAGVEAAWASAYGRLHGGDAGQQARTEGYGRMLEVLGDRALAAHATDPVLGTVGVGFGVLDRGWLGIFGMATAPAARRRGVARSVLRALTAAGAAAGAERTYLQVEVGDGPAQALYAATGFARHHGYHYRSEGIDPAQGC